MGQRDFSLCSEFVIGQLPGGQLVVDVFIERDLSLLNFFQRNHGCYRLADRACLKKSLRAYRFIGLDVLDAIRLRPLDLIIVDDGNADPRDLIKLEALLDGPGGASLDQNGRQQPFFYALDSRGNWRLSEHSM